MPFLPKSMVVVSPGHLRSNRLLPRVVDLIRPQGGLRNLVAALARFPISVNTFDYERN